MTKPNIIIPNSFAANGDKTDFDESHITNGFPTLTPDVLRGDNLNKFIDDTYKGLNGVLELYKGAVLYDVTETYSNTSIVFYIDTNDNNKIKIYHSLQNSNTGNSLSDDTYWEKVEMGGGASRNIGEIVASTIPLTDAGLHLLDGALLQYGSYQAFIDYIASIYSASANYFCTEAEWQQSVTDYGVCGKFVYDSTNNTVRLPKITGILEGTTDVTALGDLVEAGLPNITGTINTVTNTTSASGAFYNISVTSSVGGTNNYTISNAGFGINASRSSSIYGNSSTVQPQTIKAFYYIVIATSTKTNIQIDIDEIATDLNGKADVDLSNANNQAKILMSGMVMPSETYIDLTLGASGSTYTAPANGFVQVTQAFSNACYLGVSTVYTNRDGICSSQHYSSSVVLNVNIPVSKGETFKVYYGGTKTTNSSNRFQFIYAVGSESEA